jgi:hypothetical protein
MRRAGGAVGWPGNGGRAEPDCVLWAAGFTDATAGEVAATGAASVGAGASEAAGAATTGTPTGTFAEGAVTAGDNDADADTATVSCGAGATVSAVGEDDAAAGGATTCTPTAGCECTPAERGRTGSTRETWERLATDSGVTKRGTRSGTTGAGGRGVTGLLTITLGGAGG